MADTTHRMPHRTPTQLLVIARRGLEDAAQTRPAGLRYAGAHMAALRAAAAVLGVRPQPTELRRWASVWQMLAVAAPELDEWATYFAAQATKRAAAEAGLPRVVTAQEADDAVRTAEQFVEIAEVVCRG